MSALRIGYLSNLTYTYNARLMRPRHHYAERLTVIFTYTAPAVQLMPIGNRAYSRGNLRSCRQHQQCDVYRHGTGTLVINKASASVTLSNLSQAYTGSPLSATATTVPNGLSVTITYTGTSGTTYGRQRLLQRGRQLHSCRRDQQPKLFGQPAEHWL